MPRRREVPKRELLPDPVYQSPLVTKFINCMMLKGKKTTTERVSAAVVLRLLSDGSLDASFGPGGAVIVELEEATATLQVWGAALRSIQQQGVDANINTQVPDFIAGFFKKM